MTISGSIYVSKIIIQYLGDDSQKSYQIEKKLHRIFVRTVLFLDIDGVLLHGGCYNKLRDRMEQLFPGKMHGEYHKKKAAATILDVKAVRNLHALIHAFPELCIVVSSDWRLDTRVTTLRNDIFADYDFSERIISKTKDEVEQNEKYRLSDEEEDLTEPNSKNDFAYRGVPIREWLHRHPWVENYLCIDDMDIGHSFGEHFIKINPNDLLTAENVRKGYQVLMQKRNDRVEHPKTLPSHTRKKIEDWLQKHHNDLSSLILERICNLLAKYHDETAIELAHLLSNHLETFPLSREWVLLFLADKGATALIPPLFSPLVMNVKKIGLLFHKMSQQEEGPLYIQMLLQNTDFSVQIKEDLLMYLAKENSFAIIIILLTKGEPISSKTKSALLISVIGMKGIEYLVFREQEMRVAIKEWVNKEHHGNQEMETLIDLLLIDKRVGIEGKEALCRELLKRDNTSSAVRQLLEENHLSVSCRNDILIELARQEDSETVIGFLLAEEKSDPFSNEFSRGCALRSLARRAGTEQLMWLLIEQGVDVEKKREAFYSLTVRQNFNSDVIKLMRVFLDDKTWITKVSVAICLINLVGKKEAEEIVNLLYRNDDQALLSTIIHYLEGVQKEIPLMQLLLLDAVLDDELRGKLLIKVAMGIEKGEQHTEERQLLENMVKTLFATNLSSEVKGRAFIIISLGQGTEELMKLLLNKKISDHVIDHVAFSLAKKPGSEQKLNLLLDCPQPLSGWTKGYILTSLVNWEIVPFYLVNKLLNDKKVDSLQKEIAREQIKGKKEIWV